MCKISRLCIRVLGTIPVGVKTISAMCTVFAFHWVLSLTGLGFSRVFLRLLIGGYK